MVYSLGRSPTAEAERRLQWWEDRFHNAKCDNCEDWIPLSGLHTSNTGVYCCELCLHMDKNTPKFQQGEL